jgi:hypothetical protein
MCVIAHLSIPVDMSRGVFRGAWVAYHNKSSATWVPGSDPGYSKHVRKRRALGGGLCGTESTQRRSYNPLSEKVGTVSSTLGRIAPHGTLLFMS